MGGRSTDLRAVWLVGLVGLLTLGGCRGPAFFTTVTEARRLASALHVQFTRAVDASNRAVMSAGGPDSATIAKDAAQALTETRRLAGTLRPVLQQGGLQAEVGHLDTFIEAFRVYETLNAEILALASDSTNLKAQRMAAGAGQQAADAFRDALAESVAGAGPAASLLAAKARMAVMEIQVLESRHIPEPEDAAMTTLEAAMAGSERTARMALDELGSQVPAGRGASLDAAGAALDRFAATHAEVIALSRRNSNVRSLALSLGQQRAHTIACETALQALDAALAQYSFSGTR